MRTRFELLLLSIAASIHSASCLLSDTATPNGTSRTLTNDAPGELSRDTKQASGQNEDLWNMVATMRESGGSGRVEAEFSWFSKSLKLEWKIDLDSAGKYRLNWCANVSRNEILFALKINTSDSSFRIGEDIFALGFSERGELEASDFCLIWYDLSHKLHLQDARTNSENILELINSGHSVCRLLSYHHSLEPDKESPLLKAEIDYEDAEDDARLEQQKRQATDGENLEIIFTRPLDVGCEDNEPGHQKYYTIDNGTTHLVWFSLRGPLLALDGLNLSEALGGRRQEEGLSLVVDNNEHSGLRRVQMIATRPTNGRTRSTSSKLFDVRMEKYEIPARETTYMCKLFKLPGKFEARRYHITSYEAAIEAGNEPVVHHMELFNCANLSQDELGELERLASSDGGWRGECSSADQPAVIGKCKRVILAWAMGARPLVYPEQVGQSIGGPGYSPFVVLEVHYNNVARRSGLVDSSGLRFHYSSKLRPFEAGVLEVGLEYTAKNSIPPGMVAPLAGHCVSECTRAAMSANSDRRPLEANDVPLEPGHRFNQHRARNFHSNHGNQNEAGGYAQRHQPGSPLEPGIYVFAAQMHTHLTGVASWTEHVRGGKLLGELQRDNHYSPHFQEIRLLPQPVRIAPGDALIHYCLHDTRQRSIITLGGFATTDEMCVTYLHYYPKIDLEVCKSSVDSEALADYFARLAHDELQATKGPADGGQLDFISENYRSIEWSPRRSRELIEFYNLAPLSVQCNRSDGRRWPGQWNGMEPTRFFEVSGSLEGEQRSSWRAERASVPARQKSARELVDYRGIGTTRAHEHRKHCPAGRL